jgi:hypothetical protein
MNILSRPRDSHSHVEINISMIRSFLRSGLREDIIVQRLLNAEFKIEDIYLSLVAAKILIKNEKNQYE